jgi:hypothetical protein
MKAPLTIRRRRTAAKSPITVSLVIHALLAGLALSCGTSKGTEGTTIDAGGGHPDTEVDATSATESGPAEGGTLSPEAGFVDSPAVDTDTGTPGSPPRSVDASTEATADAGEMSSSGAVAFGTDPVIVTGVRDVATPPAPRRSASGCRIRKQRRGTRAGIQRTEITTSARTR